MKANRLFAFAAAGMLLVSLALAGCGGAQTEPSQTEPASTAEDATPLEEQNTQLSGGWQTYSEATSGCSDEQRAIFEKAVDGLVGVSYEPMLVLGTQVVSGTNYAFLARGTTVTANPETSWYIAVVYENLEGEASLSSVERIDLLEYL